MTYTTKDTITVDPSLSMAEKIKKIGTLVNVGLVVDGFSFENIRALRAQFQKSGQMVNRSVEVSWQAMAVYITIVWNNQNDYTAYVTDPLSLEQADAMKRAGYFVSTEVIA